MPDAQLVKWIREKYRSIVSELDERGRRRWAAIEARSLGWGGISAVAVGTGLSDRTIRNGVQELAKADDLEASRQRRAGGGRRSREDEQPELLDALDSLLEPTIRGDPMSPLRWTSKCTQTLAEALSTQGFEVSSTKIGSLLKAQGYSLQSNRKTIGYIRYSQRAVIT